MVNKRPNAFPDLRVAKGIFNDKNTIFEKRLFIKTKFYRTKIEESLRVRVAYEPLA